MARLRGAQSGFVMQQIGRLFAEGTSIGATEGELLDRFVRVRDESAFEALVACHGPMVLGVCRQMLRDPNDVDDAFQATFLVLVRKASTLRRCDLLGNWLYGVAYRVAVRARSLSARRTVRFGAGEAVESLADAEDRKGSVLDPATLMELEARPWLHQEVSHLPEKYRAPIVLCYFEGLTHHEAASRLGCPLGTVKGRLSRARDLLRRRLMRRGVTLSAAAIVSGLGIPDAQAAVPASLEMATSRAALSIACRASESLTRASSVSIPVTALAEGVLQTMIWNQVRVTSASLILAGSLATGFVVGATQLSGGPGGGGNPEAATQDSGASIAQAGRGQRAKTAAHAGGGQVAKTATTASGDSAKSISPDLLSQLSETNKSFDNMLARLRDPGIAEIDRLSTWSNLMLSANLVLATTTEDGKAARGAHRDRMKKLHEIVQKLPASAQNKTIVASHAENKLQEAEMFLEEGGHGGMMGQMASQMQGMSGRGMMSGRGAMMGGMMKGPAARKGTDRRSRPGSGQKASESSAGGAAMAPSEEPASPGMASQMMMGGRGRAMGGGMSGGGMVGMMTAETSAHRQKSVMAQGVVAIATELAIRDKNPNSRTVLKKLELPVSMSFNDDTPLEDVIKYIKVASTTETYKGIPIYVDPRGLQEAGKSMTSTVSNLDLEGIPLKATLRLLLKQIGLAYCVRDGVIIISSTQGILDELREAQQELDTAKQVDEPGDAPEPK
jgi:RNA polymerase sigma factor (sigma-70 family)